MFTLRGRDVYFWEGDGYFNSVSVMHHFHRIRSGILFWDDRYCYLNERLSFLMNELVVGDGKKNRPKLA